MSEQELTFDCEIFYVERRGRIVAICGIADFSKDILADMKWFYANQRKFGHIYPGLVNKKCTITYVINKKGLWVTGVTEKE